MSSMSCRPCPHLVRVRAGARAGARLGLGLGPVRGQRGRRRRQRGRRRRQRGRQRKRQRGRRLSVLPPLHVAREVVEGRVGVRRHDERPVRSGHLVRVRAGVRVRVRVSPHLVRVRARARARVRASPNPNPNPNPTLNRSVHLPRRHDRVDRPRLLHLEADASLAPPDAHLVRVRVRVRL